MGTAQSAPQGTLYSADVIYLLPKLGMNKGARTLRNPELGLHQFGHRTAVYIWFVEYRTFVFYTMCLLWLLFNPLIRYLPGVCGKLCDTMHIILGGKIMRTAFHATDCVVTAEARLALSISSNQVTSVSSKNFHRRPRIITVIA